MCFVAHCFLFYKGFLALIFVNSIISFLSSSDILSNSVKAVSFYNNLKKCDVNIIVNIEGSTEISIEYFIDVNLNGTPVSLFNSHKHTVMDVLLQAGINPSLLIGKNGKSIRFNLNGKRKRK